MILKISLTASKIKKSAVKTIFFNTKQEYILWKNRLFKRFSYWKNRASVKSKKPAKPPCCKVYLLYTQFSLIYQGKLGCIPFIIDKKSKNKPVDLIKNLTGLPYFQHLKNTVFSLKKCDKFILLKKTVYSHSYRGYFLIISATFCLISSALFSKSVAAK